MSQGSAQPPRFGHCEGCGEYVPMDEVDGVGGHMVTDYDRDGSAFPNHCGPVHPENDDD